MRIDESQFADIYDHFAPKIFKYCYFRVSSREEAEDIASQVFIRAWDHIIAGGRVTNIQGFLYRIASNLVIDFYRKRRDRRETSLDDPQNPIDIPDTSDPSEKLDRKVKIKALSEKLRLLPDHYQEIIVLKYVNDLSIQEIAMMMQTSENNISVRMHRAIEKLKSLI